MVIGQEKKKWRGKKLLKFRSFRKACFFDIFFTRVDIPA